MILPINALQARRQSFYFKPKFEGWKNGDLLYNQEKQELDVPFDLQAERERDITVEHLADIDRLVNESLQMLSRFQDLNTKILPLMEDYLIALRSRDNTPASLLRMDKNHEEEMINNYTSDMKAKIQGNFFSNIYSLT